MYLRGETGQQAPTLLLQQLPRLDQSSFFPPCVVGCWDARLLSSFLKTLVRSLFFAVFHMAPITDSTVSDLKDLVHKLEARVHQLEEKLGEGGKKPKTPSEFMRMILIGPPGAGEPGVAAKLLSTMADSSVS